MQAPSSQIEGNQLKFTHGQNNENKQQPDDQQNYQNNNQNNDEMNKKQNQSRNQQDLIKKYKYSQNKKTSNHIQQEQKYQKGAKKQRVSHNEIKPSLSNKTSHRYRLKQQDNGKYGNVNRSQFNTIAVASYQRNNNNKKMRLPEIGGTSADQKAKMMRSSQGGRWLKSKSLMQGNQQFRQQKLVTIPNRPPINYIHDDNNVDYLIRNYHKNQSHYRDEIIKYMKYYRQLKQEIKDNKQIYHQININDTLTQIKNKMEIYLQSIINLSNVSVDRPDGNWKQQDFTNFYTNYTQILVNNQQFYINQSEVGVKLKKYKNCAYYGPIKNGNKHGFGYLHYFSGRLFEGLFQDDEKVYGIEMGDSQIYLGKYTRNKRNGQGILKTSDYLISGIFTNDEFRIDDSKSTIISQEIDNYQKIKRKGFKIQFSNVVFYTESDMIIQKNNTNDIYVGIQNQLGQKHGEGLEIFANGDLYIGKYQQGSPEGYGEYYWNSGAFYRGNFLRGMRHGKGTWKMMHGDCYEGEYLNDKKNGQGIYTWKSGDKYQGTFQNDYRHGYGEMYWNNGKSFKGQWLNGIQINKTFKLGYDKVGKSRSKRLQDQSYSNISFNTTKTRSKILKKEQNSDESFSLHNKNTKYHAVSQLSKNTQDINHDRKIHLEKLKSMLNPTNNVN